MIRFAQDEEEIYLGSDDEVGKGVGGEVLSEGEGEFEGREGEEEEEEPEESTSDRGSGGPSSPLVLAWKKDKRLSGEHKLKDTGIPNFTVTGIPAESPVTLQVFFFFFFFHLSLSHHSPPSPYSSPPKLFINNCPSCFATNYLPLEASNVFCRHCGNKFLMKGEAGGMWVGVLGRGEGHSPRGFVFLFLFFFNLCFFSSSSFCISFIGFFSQIFQRKPQIRERFCFCSHKKR